MPEITAPDRQLLISIDMEHYSRRDNYLQYRAQQALRQVVDHGTAELGLDRANWRTQQGGDGELAIFRADAAEIAVVTRLAPTLDRRLRDHNRGLAPEARIRLRVAVHEGLVHLDGATGYPGNAVVTVCRLVDAPPLKAALREFPAANVALIVSDRIYQDIVRHNNEPRPDRFQRVLVELPGKDFREYAWVFVPDEDATRLGRHPLPEVSPAPTTHRGNDVPEPDVRATKPPLPAPPAEGGQVFNNITTHGHAAFGNHNQVSGSSAATPGDKP